MVYGAGDGESAREKLRSTTSARTKMPDEVHLHKAFARVSRLCRSRKLPHRGLRGFFGRQSHQGRLLSAHTLHRQRPSCVQEGGVSENATSSLPFVGCKRISKVEPETFLYSAPGAGKILKVNVSSLSQARTSGRHGVLSAGSAGTVQRSVHRAHFTSCDSPVGWAGMRALRS